MWWKLYVWYGIYGDNQRTVYKNGRMTAIGPNGDEQNTVMLTRLASTCQVPDKWMQGNTKVTAMKENDNCYKARIIKVKVIFRQPPPPIKEMDKFNFCNTWEQARSHIYRLHCQIGNALLILHCIIVLWQNGNIRLYKSNYIHKFVYQVQTDETTLSIYVLTSVDKRWKHGVYLLADENKA